MLIISQKEGERKKLFQHKKYENFQNLMNNYKSQFQETQWILSKNNSSIYLMVCGDSTYHCCLIWFISWMHSWHAMSFPTSPAGQRWSSETWPGPWSRGTILRADNTIHNKIRNPKTKTNSSWGKECKNSIMSRRGLSHWEAQLNFLNQVDLSVFKWAKHLNGSFWS